MQEAAQQLAKANLTTRQAECAALYFYDCKSYQQIGEILGIRKQVVHEYVQAARRKLKLAGLPAPKRCMAPEPKVVATSPQNLDRLSPDEIRTVW